MAENTPRSKGLKTQTKRTINLKHQIQIGAKQNNK